MNFKTTLYLQFPLCFNDSLQSSTQTSVKAPEMMTSGITVLLSSKRKDPSFSGSALITFSFNISDKVPESHSLSQAKKIIFKETIYHSRESETE